MRSIDNGWSDAAERVVADANGQAVTTVQLTPYAAVKSGVNLCFSAFVGPTSVTAGASTHVYGFFAKDK